VITSKRYEIGYQLVLITNKSRIRAFYWYRHRWPRLEWPWTRNSPAFCVISPNSIASQAYYVTVIEDRSIMSAKYRLSVSQLHLATHPAARSLCDSWATC